MAGVWTFFSEYQCSFTSLRQDTILHGADLWPVFWVCCPSCNWVWSQRTDHYWPGIHKSLQFISQQWHMMVKLVSSHNQDTDENDLLSSQSLIQYVAPRNSFIWNHFPDGLYIWLWNKIYQNLIPKLSFLCTLSSECCNHFSFKLFCKVFREGTIIQMTI